MVLHACAVPLTIYSLTHAHPSLCTTVAKFLQLYQQILFLNDLPESVLTCRI